ncbi:coiled-coil domain-containing protein 130 homolog isoform X2 [Fopius arisanus]|uniref:Coiled-coil domain-containing protein 130 homolog isoform X2 n=1 Tax=Fopius arisanus TaxID=64838 RepID=A0A9R1TT18_9HYME|nr:PREDICTED: coiled-coil domain-containing protein 130 homolog isoform X2 [Fopius arisanus]XP_011314701.1 PREDICTED: coiled-coil domain-containing protein 130 homolog isoform X2 [Fopius arisanus]
MGERKGQNLYYPPDYDPKVGGLNKFLGTHALRERARKLHMGILIIRFEMPFNIWCEGCGNHIGMGVRYNAEKKKIGMYYSTPLYSFRMKCHLCDNHFEIKTDPGNLTYVIESGARRQENRWDPKENEQVVPETKEVSKRLYDDAMFKLEHGVDDLKASKTQDPAINKILAKNESRWQDDYSANAALRAAFRSRKNEDKERKKEIPLLKSVGVELDLVDEHEDDVKLARILMRNKKREPKRNKTLSLKRLVSIVSKSKSKRKGNLGIQSKPQIIEQKKILSNSDSSSSSNVNTSLVSYESSSSDGD